MVTQKPADDNTVNKSRIAIFASGAGTNAAQIIAHFKQSRLAEITLIVCNNPNAGVLNIALNNYIDELIIEKENFFGGNAYLWELQNRKIDLIILAGFLWKIPQLLIDHYKNKIINIHPALLPKHGGKGMYGARVHEAVIAAGEKESGITIHLVDEHYDNGDIIFQATCPVLPNDNAADLAKKIHALEYEHYPAVIENMVRHNLSLP